MDVRLIRQKGQLKKIHKKSTETLTASLIIDTDEIPFFLNERIKTNLISRISINWEILIGRLLFFTFQIL